MDAEIREIYDKINIIATDVAVIKANQDGIHEFVSLYTSLDARLHKIEIQGHGCIQMEQIQLLNSYMLQQQGAQQAQKPFWETFKSIFAGVIIGVIMLVMGYGLGKN